MIILASFGVEILKNQCVKKFIDGKNQFWNNEGSFVLIFSYSSRFFGIIQGKFLTIFDTLDLKICFTLNCFAEYPKFITLKYFLHIF